VVRQQKCPLRPLTDDERETLALIARSRRERADRATRARVILSVAAGASFTEAAHAVGRRSGDAVARLVARWNVEGVEALTPRHGGGPAPAGADDPVQLIGDAARSQRRPRPSEQRRGQRTIQRRLTAALKIDGAVAAALVEAPTGRLLATVGNNGLDLATAAAGNARVVQAKLAVMSSLGLSDEIEDILISLNTQYHLIRPVGADHATFLYLVLDRAGAQLALARRGLRQLEDQLTG
jgi:hypothetical protein